jgi:hypothetical protein
MLAEKEHYFSQFSYHYSQSETQQVQTQIPKAIPVTDSAKAM